MRRGCFVLLMSVLLPAFTAVAKPNVVIFYADDFGWGDMRLHNTNPAHFRYTPTLDNLFTQGIRFENYITHCVCSPSRAGLLTGKHYANVGAGPRTGGTLPNDIQNFAKDFQAAGYVTGAFGKWHNSLPNFPEEGNGARVPFSSPYTSYNGLHRETTLNLTDNIFHNHKNWTWGEGVNAYGFDRWVGFYNGGGDLFDRYVSWHHDIDWWHDRSYRADETGYTTDLITQHAMDFIQNNQANSFLCYVPQQAVHTPLHLKRSDLQEFCGLLDTELGITGKWDFVKNIQGVFKVNPATGERDDTNGVFRTIGNTEKIRAETGQEFGILDIDPTRSHYAPLMYAAYCYTLDKSVGNIIQKVIDIGQITNTVFFFTSDNGATLNGINQPFRGGKHSLYEGGVHVPAAIWWPGTFDKNTAPYSPSHNTYSGMISYLDIYPTLMAMTGNPLLGTNLDGINCWPHLQANTECRPDTADAIYGMWLDYGSVRTKRWKLLFSESKNQTVLYDLYNDIAETTNVASANPAVRDQLIAMYRNWLTTNSYAVSYVKIAASDIDYPNPAPSGDLLEIKATQTASISNPDANGVFVRFSNGTGWDDGLYEGCVHAGDRVEFDIYVSPESTVTRGCFFTTGNGWTPFYNSSNGKNQSGVLLANLDLPKGVWTRQVVGIGNYSPGTISVNYIAFRSTTPGYYHFYLDNIVVRKADGTIRSVIWQSGADFASLIYRYKNNNYNTLAAAQAVSGFPFSDIQITTQTGVEPPSGNLVRNPSFESGSSFWTLGSTASVVTENAQDGSASLRMVNYASGSTRQTVPTEVGITYDISVWINGTEITAGAVVFDTFDQYDGPGQGQFTVGNNAGWTQYTGSFTATSDVVTLRMFAANSSFAGAAYFDSVALIPRGGSSIQHLDAAVAASVTGSPVTQWADQTTNANHAVPAVGSVYYPSASLSASGRAGLGFGAPGTSLELFSAAESERWLDFTGAAAANSGFAVLVAFKCDDLYTDNWNDVLGNSSAVASGFGLRYNNAGSIQAYLGGATINRAGHPVQSGDTVIFAFNYNSSAGSYTFWDSRNGSEVTASISAANFSKSTAVTLGRTDNASRYMNGMVGEVKVFDSVLSSSEFQAERSALVAKWITERVSGYDAWVIENRITGGPLDDDDADGLANFLEYAIAEKPVFEGMSGFFHYSFKQRNDDPNLTYTVEVCTDLAAGVWTPAATTAVTTIIGGAYDQVTHQISSAAPRLFIRLKITNQ